MRLALLLLPLLIAQPALSQVNSLDSCRQAIATDPATAREAAAQWARSRGGTQAAMCEAFTLDALGASAAAATRLTEIAQAPGSGLDAGVRASLFTRAGQLWQSLGQLQLAQTTLSAALDLAPSEALARDVIDIALARNDGPTAAAAAPLAGALPPMTAARIALSQGAAAEALEILAGREETPPLRLLRARALQVLGQPQAALAELARIDPDEASVQDDVRRLARDLMLSAQTAEARPGLAPATAPRPMSRRP